MEFEEFLRRLGSATPTPGGGSASAVVGSIAISLTKMVANLTVNKKGYESVQERMGEIIRESDVIMSDFLKLEKEDEDAFNLISQSWKLPRATEEEKQARKRKINEATLIAIRPPLKIASRAIRTIELATYVMQNGNRNAISDALCSAEFAYSAFKGSISNVNINLKSLPEEMSEGENLKVKLLEGYASNVYNKFMKLYKETPLK